VLDHEIEHAAPDAGTEIALYFGGGFHSALAADTIQKIEYIRVLSIAGGCVETGDPTAQQ